MPDSSKILPLQSKVSATLAIVITVLTVASYLVLRAIVMPAFRELEMDAASADFRRAEMAIRTDLENLEAITADWAPWDDIYGYVRGENPGFARSSLKRPTLINLGLDFMAIYGLNGRLMWGQALIDGQEVAIGELQMLEPGSSTAPVLIFQEQPESRAAGFVATARGPALISARPILRSDDSGPVAGALVMGQLLDAEHLARLRERTGVDIHWDFGAAAIAARQAGIVGDVVVNSDTLTDILGEPYVVLETRTPRRIWRQGSRTVNAALIFLVATGVFATAFVWFNLRSTILRPLAKLAAHIGQIRSSGDLSRQLDSERNDEIGALSRQFDHLTTEVSETRRALLDQSFKAGKADTAAEVLHNIRNAMTPLINGLDRLGRAFKVTDRLRMAEVVEELGDPDCPAERKGKLLEYVDTSFRHIAEVGADALDDLGVATAQARQIEGILSDQEELANIGRVTEDVAMDTVLSEATHVIPKEARPAVNVEVPGSVAQFRVKAHRIGLLQVVSNLILNAYESIQRSERTDGRIELDITDQFLDGRSMVRLTVRDNGSGFESTASERIFQRGYTSKTKGETTGLGLHWCATAVAGMGGSIVAVSRGPGQGAEFHVLLPAAQQG